MQAMPDCAERGNYDKLLKAVKLVFQRKLDKDRFSEWLYKAHFTNEITRREYHDLFCQMEQKLHDFCNDRELSNILKRMDWRTLGEFALTIFDNTKREKILAEAWVDMCEEKGLFSQAVLEDYGMSNDGMLKFALRGVNHRPDFKITVYDSSIEIPDGVHKLEVKYCPSSKFLTYKAADLESYIKENSYVLTVVGENRMIGANGNPDLDDSFDVNDLGISWWTVMTPEIMKYMLQELPVRRYEGYMGNKPSVRLYKDDQPKFSEYFELREWN